MSVLLFFMRSIMPHGTGGASPAWDRSPPHGLIGKMHPLIFLFTLSWRITMDYRHLKYFMEVAEQKSFSKAARNLHISQSAISRMIKSLEDELGVVLFIRNAKTVEITAPGTIFLNYAKRCLFIFEHLKSDFENEFNLKQDTMRSGCRRSPMRMSLRSFLANSRRTIRRSPSSSMSTVRRSSRPLSRRGSSTSASSVPFRITNSSPSSFRRMRCASSCRRAIRSKSTLSSR